MILANTLQDFHPVMLRQIQVEQNQTRLIRWRQQSLVAQQRKRLASIRRNPEFVVDPILFENLPDEVNVGWIVLDEKDVDRDYRGFNHALTMFLRKLLFYRPAGRVLSRNMHREFRRTQALERLVASFELAMRVPQFCHSL